MSAAARIPALAWETIGDELDAYGSASLGSVLDAAEAADVAAIFDDERFRSTIDMARHRHGVSVVRSGHRRTLGVILHDAA